MTKPIKTYRRHGIFSSSILFGITLFLAISAYRFASFVLSRASSERGRYVFYEVKKSQSAASIATELAAAGVVSDARLFYWYGRLTGRVEQFKAGDYRFSTRMRPGEVMTIIMSGVSFGYPLRVPEGYSMAQIGALIEEFRPGGSKQFLRICRDKRFLESLGLPEGAASAEGYLFPDTYLVGRKLPEAEIIQAMHRKYKNVFTPELRNRASLMGMTEHQVVTLASIIEKETGASHERPLISSVFHNRLKKRMRLQSDPTVIYAVRDYNGNITKRHLEDKNAYNTYHIRGLPPGPIGNPGKEAILAALYPAQSEYLYFVSKNDGTHEFTTNYDDHKGAVQKYQLDRKAREGKSWRDLNRPANR